MRKMTIALGLVAVMLFAGGAFAADQTRSKVRAKTGYQTGTQDQTRTRDRQKSLGQDRTQVRDRARNGSSKTTN